MPLSEEDMDKDDEIELIDYMRVIVKRRWLIISGTLILVIIAAIAGFVTKKQWEIDCIMVPSKFVIQNDQGAFTEVVVLDPRQVAGQIDQESYNMPIALSLNMNLREFPRLHAENLRDTKLVRIWIRSSDVERAKTILNSLFTMLKAELDRKVEVEFKGIDTKIATNVNLIKQKDIDIATARVDITIASQEMAADRNKLKISEERFDKITGEMKSVKQRIDEIEAIQKKTLGETRGETSTLALLMYANEIQQNIRYYDTLDEKLNTERILQENLRLEIKAKEQLIKQIDNQCQKLGNEIDNIRKDNDLLAERKLRLDYAQMVKAPTSSLYPISPKKKLRVAGAGILGILVFGVLAFVIEYWEKHSQSPH